MVNVELLEKLGFKQAGTSDAYFAGPITFVLSGEEIDRSTTPEMLKNLLLSKLEVFYITAKNRITNEQNLSR